MFTMTRGVKYIVQGTGATAPVSAVECDTCNQKSLDCWTTANGGSICEPCIDDILKVIDEYGIDALFCYERERE
jgi:hypothetical protein